MGINLKKGEKISLVKENPGLEKIIIGLGWDTNKYSTGGDFDIDTSVFLLTENGKVKNQNDFVFYGNLVHSSGAVTHRGDNRSGAGDGDDEEIVVELSKIPEYVTKIVITATIYDAAGRKQNFGQISNSYIRVVDESKKTEILKYDLGEDYSVETAVVFGELYKQNNEWKFNAIGSGFNGELAALCANYGISVD